MSDHTKMQGFVFVLLFVSYQCYEYVTFSSIQEPSSRPTLPLRTPPSAQVRHTQKASDYSWVHRMQNRVADMSRRLLVSLNDIFTVPTVFESKIKRI